MSFIRDSLSSVATVSNVQLPLQSESGDSGCSGFSMSTDMRPETVSPGPSSRTSSSQLDFLGTDSDSWTSPQPPPRTPTPGSKEQKTLADKNAELRSALVTALREPTQPDAVDGFLAQLGEGLRRIPYRERAQLEIKFLSMLMEVEDKLHL